MLSLIGQAVVIAMFLVSCVVTVFLLQYLARRFVQEEEDHPKFKVTRGQAVGTLEQAKKDLDKNAPPIEEDPRTIPHGGLWLCRSEETKHKVVVGATGSGKSLTMVADLGAIAPRLLCPIGNETVSLVAYDDKRMLAPIVAGLVGQERMKIIAPFDMRSVAVDVASLFNTKARARRLAEIYIPNNPKGETQPYWNNASRDLVTETAMVFNKLGPGKWTLRDLHQRLIRCA